MATAEEIRKKKKLMGDRPLPSPSQHPLYGNAPNLSSVQGYISPITTPLDIPSKMGRAAVNAYDNGIGKTAGQAYRGAVTGASNLIEGAVDAGGLIAEDIRKTGQAVGEGAFNVVQGFKEGAGIRPTITPAPIAPAAALPVAPIETEEAAATGEEDKSKGIFGEGLPEEESNKQPSEYKDVREMEGIPGVFKNEALSKADQKKYGKAIYSDTQAGATTEGFDADIQKYGVKGKDAKAGDPRVAGPGTARGFDEDGKLTNVAGMDVSSPVSQEASDYYDKNGTFTGFNITENAPEGGGGLSWHEKAKIAQSKMPFGSRGDVYKRKAIQSYIDSLKGVAQVESAADVAQQRTDIERFKATNPTPQSQVGRFKYIDAVAESYDPVSNITTPAQPAGIVDSATGQVQPLNKGESPEQAYKRVTSGASEGGGYESPEAIGEALKSGKIKTKAEALKMMTEQFPEATF